MPWLQPAAASGIGVACDGGRRVRQGRRGWPGGAEPDGRSARTPAVVPRRERGRRGSGHRRPPGLARLHRRRGHGRHLGRRGRLRSRRPRRQLRRRPAHPDRRGTPRPGAAGPALEARHQRRGRDRRRAGRPRHGRDRLRRDHRRRRHLLRPGPRFPAELPEPRRVRRHQPQLDARGLPGQSARRRVVGLLRRLARQRGGRARRSRDDQRGSGGQRPAAAAAHQRFEHGEHSRGDRGRRGRPGRIRRGNLVPGSEPAGLGTGRGDLEHGPPRRRGLQRRLERGGQPAGRLHRRVRRNLGGDADGVGRGRAHAGGKPAARLARRAGDPGAERAARRLGDRLGHRGLRAVRLAGQRRRDLERRRPALLERLRLRAGRRARRRAACRDLGRAEDLGEPARTRGGRVVGQPRHSRRRCRGHRPGAAVRRRRRSRGGGAAARDRLRPDQRLRGAAGFARRDGKRAGDGRRARHVGDRRLELCEQRLPRRDGRRRLAGACRRPERRRVRHADQRRTRLLRRSRDHRRRVRPHRGVLRPGRRAARARAHDRRHRRRHRHAERRSGAVREPGRPFGRPGPDRRPGGRDRRHRARLHRRRTRPAGRRRRREPPRRRPGRRPAARRRRPGSARRRRRRRPAVRRPGARRAVRRRRARRLRAGAGRSDATWCATSGTAATACSWPTSGSGISAIRDLDGEAVRVSYAGERLVVRGLGMFDADDLSASDFLFV